MSSKMSPPMSSSDIIFFAFLTYPMRATWLAPLIFPDWSR
jgi:hypothetical protein